MAEPRREQSDPASILGFVRDLPNVCSLAGLFCALLGIYFAVLGVFPAAMIGLLWAVLFDWSDGIVTRRMKGRADGQRAFGVQLDSLIDVVSFGVCPAVLLLSYGRFSPWFLPGAFAIVAACALRLSYFNVFGLVGHSTYLGLAVDNNAIVIVLVFLLEGIIAPTIFASLLYATVIVLAAFNVAPIRTPKFAGRWFYALAAYVLIMTAIYAGRLWTQFHSGGDL